MKNSNDRKVCCITYALLHRYFSTIGLSIRKKIGQPLAVLSKAINSVNSLLNKIGKGDYIIRNDIRQAVSFFDNVQCFQ